MSKIYVQSDDGEMLVCPIRYALDIIGGKWKQPIMCMLAPGVPLRNSAIKKRLNGITNIMLSQSLKELEAAGIIHRKQYNEVPPRVEYTITEKGKRLVPALLELATWAQEMINEEKACGSHCTSCRAVE